MFRILILCSVMLPVSGSVNGQEIKPSGYFSKDSIKIGEQLEYTLAIHYPRGIEVLFPDSTYDYSPFEFVKKKYYSTVSDQSTSFDSVIYQLTTFELDSVQKLSLPVFLITSGDSIELNAASDSVLLQFVITESIDSLDIRETTQYQNVSKAFNYPYLLLALAALLVIALLVAIFFGKEIRKRFKLYRLRKSHEKFMERFGQMEQDGLHTAAKAEHLLGFWKGYLEKLEGMPYTKLTTKEIVTIEQNQEFKDTLRSMDSNIYGEFNDRSVSQLISKLKQFGINRYTEKFEELKHA